MTMQEVKLEQLTKKIQELVPEIMELKFGCLVRDFQHDTCFVLHNDEGTIIAYAWCGDKHYFPPDFYYSDEDKKKNRVKKFNKDEDGKYEFEILGRDIQLADCVIAISESGTLLRGSIKDETLEKFGLWFKDVQSWSVGDLLLCFWNNKTLHQQSPETIDFLHSILCL